MTQTLLSEIEAFIRETGMAEFRFGYKSAKNGRLVERLRDGGRVWPETEQAIRQFMAEARADRAKAACKSSDAA